MDGGNGIRRRMFPEWALGISASVFWVSSCIQTHPAVCSLGSPRSLTAFSHHTQTRPTAPIACYTSLWTSAPYTHVHTCSVHTHTCTHTCAHMLRAHTRAHMLLPSLILQDVCCSAVQPPHPLHLPSAVFAFSLILIDLFEEWKRAGICCVLLFLLAFSCFCFFFVLMLRSARSLSLHLLLWCQHFSRRLHVVHAGLTPVNPAAHWTCFFY